MIHYLTIIIPIEQELDYCMSATNVIQNSIGYFKKLIYTQDFIMIKHIPIYCKQCHAIDIVGIGMFQRMVQRKWDLIWQNMSMEEKQKAFDKKIPGPIDRTISPKKLRDILNKDGQIEFGCRKCLASVTDDWYKRQGYNSVKYGNVVVDINYYEAHQKEVSVVIAEMRDK
jgi:hypothetical protein